MAVTVDGNICSNGLDTVLFTDKLENHQLWWEHLGSGDRPTLKKTRLYLNNTAFDLLCMSGVPFPRNFLSVAKTILKRLFRVYAHVYHQHRDDVRRLDEEAHLNTSFKHFIFFIEEFSLIDKKELTPLQDLIDILNAKDQRWLALRCTTCAYHSSVSLITFLQC